MHKLLLLLLTLLPTAAFSTTNYDPGVNGNIGGAQVTNWTAYTPTITGLGTTTGLAFFWRRVGDNLEVRGKLTAGTASGMVSITLPSGLTIDTSKSEFAAATGNNCPWVGFYQQDGANLFGNLAACTTTSTSVIYAAQGVTNSTPMNAQSAGSLLNSSILTSFRFSVPISGWSAGGAGGATLPRCQIEVYDSPGNASTNTNIKRFSNTKINSCSAGDATYADSSTAGGSFTINITGVYDATYCDYGSGATQHGISVDSTQLTTAYSSISASTQGNGINTAANTPACVTYHSSVTTVPQVWRAHNGNGGATGDNRIKFTLTKVSN